MSQDIITVLSSEWINRKKEKIHDTELNCLNIQLMRHRRKRRSKGRRLGVGAEK